MESKQEHWDNVFASKSSHEVSWTQDYPRISMQFISEINLPKTAKILEVGGGEGFLVDALLEKGYTNITVIDISGKAIEKTKLRLGEKANLITWVVTDIIQFNPVQKFDFWHDRAVFHFLTKENEIEEYKIILDKTLVKDGYFLLGTFSSKGPFKCSGLDIIQYDAQEMKELFEDHFTMIHSYQEKHKTPFETYQDFQFGGFKKITNK